MNYYQEVAALKKKDFWELPVEVAANPSNIYNLRKTKNK